MKKTKNGSIKNELKKIRNLRIRLTGILLTLGLAVLVGYMVHLYIEYGDAYTRAANTSHWERLQANVNQELRPTQGAILDRHHWPMAESEVVYSVILDVNTLHYVARNRPARRDATLQALHEALDYPMEDLIGYFETHPGSDNLVRRTYWRPLRHQVPAEIAHTLADFPQVILERNSRRRYPYPFLAPHVIGFVRGGTALGLEHQYRPEIVGESGRIFTAIHLDASPIIEEPPRDGYTLITTIDSRIQTIAQDHVNRAAERYQSEFVSLLIMQPHTGEILAMAQWPSFSTAAPVDSRYFTDSNLAANWDNLYLDEQFHYLNSRLWHNFNVSRSFEPGSTFKPFVIAAALEERLISPETDAFFCGGRRRVADWDAPCHNRAGHRSLTLEEAIMFSCNIAMIEIIEILTGARFYQYRNDFGFGERTNIDLPGESTAIVYALNQLGPVQRGTNSMGQGFSATPIQMLTAFSALINGGNLMQPFVVSQIVNSNGEIVQENPPTLVRRVISQETSDYMRRTMQSVVSRRGTGHRAIIDNFNMGGKTGTAQQGMERDWYVASFIGYLPVENPQVIAMAVIYNPRDSVFGGQAAAPLLRDALTEVIEHMQILPSGEIYTTRPRSPDSIMIGDFTNLELRDVSRNLSNLEFDFSVRGSGSIVVSQFPAGGNYVSRGTQIFLDLDNNIDDLDNLGTIPDVTGLSYEEASFRITVAGFIPHIITETATHDRDWISEPVTGALLAPESEAGSPERLTVTHQWPQANNTHPIQLGTTVRLHVR